MAEVADEMQPKFLRADLPQGSGPDRQSMTTITMPIRLRNIMISNVSRSRLTARPATAIDVKDTIAPIIQSEARMVGESGIRSLSGWGYCGETRQGQSRGRWQQPDRNRRWSDAINCIVMVQP